MASAAMTNCLPMNSKGLSDWESDWESDCRIGLTTGLTTELTTKSFQFGCGTLSKVTITTFGLPVEVSLRFHSSKTLRNRLSKFQSHTEGKISSKKFSNSKLNSQPEHPAHRCATGITNGFIGLQSFDSSSHNTIRMMCALTSWCCSRLASSANPELSDANVQRS